MFALLGDIPFDLLQSPTGLNETHNANFAKHNVLAGKPRLQSTGLDLIQREMSLRLHYKLGNVESRFNAIVNAFQNQLPLPLIMGRSQFHGFFVIESIQSQTTQTNAQGVVLARDLSLRLQEVADVKPPSPKGLAVIENNLPPVLAKTLDSIQKAGSTAIDTIKQGLNVVQKVNSAINRASHIANTINTFADNPVAALSAMPNAQQQRSNTAKNK